MPKVALVKLSGTVCHYNAYWAPNVATKQPWLCL